MIRCTYFANQPLRFEWDACKRQINPENLDCTRISTWKIFRACDVAIIRHWEKMCNLCPVACSYCILSTCQKFGLTLVLKRFSAILCLSLIYIWLILCDFQSGPFALIPISNDFGSNTWNQNHTIFNFNIPIIIQKHLYQSKNGSIFRNR